MYQLAPGLRRVQWRCLRNSSPTIGSSFASHAGMEKCPSGEPHPLAHDTETYDARPRRSRPTLRWPIAALTKSSAENEEGSRPEKATPVAMNPALGSVSKNCRSGAVSKTETCRNRARPFEKEILIFNGLRTNNSLKNLYLT